MMPWPAQEVLRVVLSPYEEKLLESVISQLSRLDEVVEIIVFGSRARGQSREDSDLDLLVLTSMRDPGLLREIESLKALALPDMEDFLYVNLIPLAEAEYRKDPGLFRANVDREGVTVWKRS